jgi:hypothetical protein
MLPTSPVTLLPVESCVELSQPGTARSCSSEGASPDPGFLARCCELIYTNLLCGRLVSQYYARGDIVTKTTSTFVRSKNRYLSFFRTVPELLIVLLLVHGAVIPLLAAPPGLSRRSPSVASAAVQEVVQEQSTSQNNPDQGTARQSRSTPLTLDDVVARDVLEPLRNGMQGHSLRQVLGTFDSQSMPDYPSLRDQLRAMFQNYSTFLFRYKLLQLTSEGDRASAICEIDLEATPVDENALTMRRSVQMRLQLKHTSNGWKIVSFSPGDFFAQ